jgi:hypothetical protein
MTTETSALAGLEIAYILTDRACVTGQVLPVHLAWLTSLAVAVAGGLIGRREWQRWGGMHAGEEDGREGRSRFLALLGMLVSAEAALAIAAQWSATLFFHPCQ